MGNQSNLYAFAFGAASAALAVVLFQLGPVQEATEAKSRKLPAFLPRKKTAFFLLILVTDGFIGIFLSAFYKATAADILLTVLWLAVAWPCAWYDFRLHIIPNKILLAGILVRILGGGLEFFIWSHSMVYVLVSALIAAGALMAVVLICRLISPGSVGLGDAKMLGVMGLYLGMDKTWGAIFCSMILLFIYAAYLLIRKKADRKSELPLAPFVLAGTLIGAVLTGI